MKKIISFLFILAFLIMPAIVTAHTESDPFVTDLIAGGPTTPFDVGDVMVWNDGVYVNVKYVITDPDWCLSETHLHVATSLEDIPQVNGNPVPGQFDYSDSHTCVSEWIYQVPLTWDTGTSLYIAAHAVVGRIDMTQYETAWGAGFDFPGDQWAKYFIYTVQGTTTDLIAGGGGKGKSAIDVGDVLVWNDAENLYVQYVVDAPWCITETHLQVATSFEGIPQKKGNPIPGLFDYSGIHECVPEVTYTIPLDSWTPGDTVYLAAHAVVAQEVVVDDSSYIQFETGWGAGYVFPGKNWATYFTYGVECLYNPAIDIEKSTNGEDADDPPGPYILVGEPVTWEYMVTNTGDVPLSNVEVVDDRLGPICVGDLDVGESMTCSATVAAAEAGQYSNMGTATGTDVCGNSVTDTDSSHYFGSAPAIYIEQLPDGSYLVINIGNVPLDDINVTGEPGETVTCPKTSLEPGESMICTVSA